MEIRRNNVLEKTDIVQAHFSAAVISSLLPLTTYSISIFTVSEVGRSRPSVINGSTLSLSMLLQFHTDNAIIHYICRNCKSHFFKYHYTVDNTIVVNLASKLINVTTTMQGYHFHLLKASAINVRDYYSSNAMDSRSLHSGWNFSSKHYNNLS